MRNKDLHKAMALLTFASPIVGWLGAAKKYNLVELTHPKIKGFVNLLPHTTEHLPLMAMPAGFTLTSIALWVLFHKMSKQAFTGAEFKEFLRGTEIVLPHELIRKTKDKDKRPQVKFATIPMPIALENLHTLLNGSTGTGKSVALRRIAFDCLLRKDRIIVADNNGDLYSKFGRPNDVILNPHDIRTKGWTFYNEIRKDYDFDRLSRSVIPMGNDSQSEEWCGYARLLLRETAKRLHSLGDHTIHALHQLTTVAEAEDLKNFLSGTPAESLFVEGAERALGSARFVLSKYLPAHLTMPDGDFSLRDWLENPNGGNLFITWREDMAESLRPLISCFLDILFSSLLSMPEDEQRRLWAFIDELASLEALSSLEAALTKGRKAGLRVVAGLQSISQLDMLYGKEKATVLRSCFRNLVVLGGSKTDADTAKAMSIALGTHDVIRDNESHTSANKGGSTNRSEHIETDEPVVTPAEITSLPDLTAYVAFATNYPITRVLMPVEKFETINTAIQEA